MNYNQKVLLGVAVVGLAGYYYYKSQQPKKQMVGANGSLFAGRPDAPVFANFKDEACKCHTGSDKVKGQTIYKCGDGVSLSDASNGPCKGRKAQQ
jgi:hypothetical protein